MKSYKKRINIWVDEEFELDVAIIKNYLEKQNGKYKGKITNSDAIRLAVHSHAQDFKRFVDLDEIEI